MAVTQPLHFNALLLPKFEWCRQSFVPTPHLNCNRDVSAHWCLHSVETNMHDMFAKNSGSYLLFNDWIWLGTANPRFGYCIHVFPLRLVWFVCVGFLAQFWSQLFLAKNAQLFFTELARILCQESGANGEQFRTPEWKMDGSLALYTTELYQQQKNNNKTALSSC